jgi:hypothetical protein
MLRHIALGLMGVDRVVRVEMVFRISRISRIIRVSRVRRVSRITFCRVSPGTVTTVPPASDTEAA